MGVREFIKGVMKKHYIALDINLKLSSLKASLLYHYRKENSIDFINKHFDVFCLFYTIIIIN